MEQHQQEQTESNPKLSEVIRVLVVIGTILVSAGLAYGNITSKTVELENRIAVSESIARERDEQIQLDVREIKQHLASIESYLRNGSNRPANPEGGRQQDR
jgi:hypothetical protein